ncbi:B12-binding domain-containing radical SAM protein, partial [candidate division KSB1 bacterium]|nr:B12-binding domain-containing radical SAM protein [candidate division KSB1 bacterium]
MKKAILCFPAIDSKLIQYPTGLYKIATYCNSYYEIIIIDQRIFSNPIIEINNLIENEGVDNILCLGLSVMTGQQIQSALEISKVFHDKLKIVWGGIHPTILPKQTISNKYIDYVIIGEGERAFLNLLNYLCGKENDYHLFLSKVNRNLTYNYLSDLTSHKYIDFSKYKIDDSYFIKRDGFKKAFTIETSRGCPHNCYYCHNSIFKKPYRFIKSSKIIEIIDVLYNCYKIDGIIFQEDNFFVNIKRVQNIIDYFIKNKSVGWKTNCRIDYFNKFIDDIHFMNNLVKSGCNVLQFGIESGSQRILNLINKKIKIEDVIKINKKLSMYPINIRYNFIIGFPTETKSEMQATLDLINRLLLDNRNVEPPFLNIYNP